VPPQKILFISHVDSYFSGFIDLVRMLNGSAEFEPSILFPANYPNLAKHVEICRAEHIAFTSLANPIPSGASRSEFLAKVKRSIIARSRGALFGFPVIGYLRYLMMFRSKLRIIRRILASNKPDLLVLGGDIVGHDMALYIKAGHELAVPSVLLPGWMASAREPAELNFENTRFFLNRPMNRLLGYFFPHWVYTHRGRALVRQPAQEALALETLRLAPPLPWILHSGFADKIAVESEAMLRYGLAEGLSKAALVITGSRTHDKMHDQIIVAREARAKLCSDLGLTPDKPLLLSALPPDMLYGLGRPECEFSNFRDLASFWISSIRAAADGNVVVSLHPSARKEYEPFIAELGAKISDQPVAELIPLCDYYVACISATIQWAIACGKPVINYDVYRYRYTDYVGLKGVLTVEEQDQFLGLLRRMATDSAFRNEIAALQKTDAPRWGNLDGKAGQRIVELFHELIEAGKHRRAYWKPAAGLPQHSL
jgi:hypothetical protein